MSSDENHTLNFGAEYDEFNKDINANSLFSRFYQQYVVQTYNQNGRIIKVSANLPVSFVLNYGVNDVIVINGKEYYINSIQTDLTTGKSQLELIEGFLSEQKSNSISLTKEKIELELSNDEATAVRQNEERLFNAEMEQNEVKRIQTMLDNLEIEKQIEEERLLAKRNSYEEGTILYRCKQ